MKYSEFLVSKRWRTPATGRHIPVGAINPMLFPFQRDITRWALRKGCAAIFADCGLGKTFMQLEWARLLDTPTLIIAPLNVAQQTAQETRLGAPAIYLSEPQGNMPQITITNYEHVEKFDADDFGAVVLDESSILKSLDGKTRQLVTEKFKNVPHRLCCTATPAPNDIAEIANHAEFLGVMKRTDMLASFFVHDDDGWRLKGHAEQPFYRWLASWSMAIRKPSDLGYDDNGYVLPGLNIERLAFEQEFIPEGSLFFTKLKGIQERLEVRKAAISARVEAVAALLKEPGQWIAWCGLNEESESLAAVLGDDAIEVPGYDDPDKKAAALSAFQNGRYRILVTKPKVAGLGMNLQNCHQMAFVGLGDSYESYYQSIRRCYRFGQEHPVRVVVVLAEQEAEIYANVLRKEKEADELSASLIAHAVAYEKEELQMPDKKHAEKPKHHKTTGEGYEMVLGDSVEELKHVADGSVGLSVFSPPFVSLYTYSPTERDIGNSKDETEFFKHFGFIIDELLRATMPGRNCCVHVSQVPAMLVRDGYIGVKDFRGMTIQNFEKRGWTYHGEVCIDKDPQAQAIRTHSKALLFVQMRRDAAWLRPALADYILVFRKPGENASPVLPDMTNDQWIEWARPIWYGINETDTLNKAVARENADERHICPLQLGTIERCVKLWSNRGDLVLSPFAGIGSEGYVALKHGRRFHGIELKESYYRAALANLKEASEYTEAPLFQAKNRLTDDYLRDMGAMDQLAEAAAVGDDLP